MAGGSRVEVTVALAPPEVMQGRILPSSAPPQPAAAAGSDAVRSAHDTPSTDWWRPSTSTES
eukprot:552990-Alexandrium_andersonii.AAC.1